MTPIRHMVPALILTSLLILGACDDDQTTAPEPPAEYQVEVSGEQFVVRVTDQAQIDDLEARLASGEPGVVTGTLEAGDGGFNTAWSWHMVPSTVETADMSIEVCDGRPSMVEENLDYWLDTVGRFCPWSAVVTGRM